MPLCDTHCHLTVPEIPGGFGAAAARARSAGVSHIVVVESDPARFRETPGLCSREPGLLPACGIHPCYLPANPDAAIESLKAVADSLVAIGEIGLDGTAGDLPEQERVFRAQLQIAKDARKPILIHCRRALPRLLAILKDFGCPPGVMHCYSGSAEQLPPLLDVGLYISYAGVVTFPGARKVHPALAATPLDRVLLETDSPDLAPHPLRGTVNEPANLPLVAQGVADSLHLSFEKISEITFANSRQLFGF
ncbi:MAG: TatD family hydrolase [Candidatus Brocadiia bacterium]